MYETHEAILIGKDIPDQKLCKFYAIVAEDANNNLIPLIYNIEPVEERWKIKVSEEEHKIFKQYFHKPIEELEMDLDESIAPDIVGRRRAKFGVATTLHSPAHLLYDGRLVLAMLRTLLFGDTTTAKTRLLKAVEGMGIPTYIISEIARRTGLVGTVDKDNGVIIWGKLVENDLGYVGLDGIHSLDTEQMLQLREALRQGTVEIVLQHQGKAFARVRMIATVNTKDGMTLDDYPYKCQAILDSRPFSDPTDVT